MSIVLLRGPSTNVVPIGCLADNLPNSGKFVWTPSSSLEADVSHYGLQIIVTGTGQYQYSTQFGISNPIGSVTTKSATASQITDGQVQAPVSTSAKGATVSQITDGQIQAPAATSATISAIVSNSANVTSVPIVKTSTSSPSVYYTNSANSTTTSSTPAVTVTLPAQAPVPVGSGLPSNSSIIQPTGNLTVPATLQTSAQATGGSSTKASAPISTGAAAKTVAGGMFAGLGMFAAFVL